MKNRPILILAAILVVFTLRSTKFNALTATDILLSIAITFASLGPMVRWVLKGMDGLPLFEFFCFFHFPYYAYPILAAKQKFMVYSDEDRTNAELVILAFLGCAIFAYYYYQITLRRRVISQKQTIWRRELSGVEHVKGFSCLLVVWAIISLVNSLGYGGMFGSFLNLARSIASPGGAVALFYFFHNIGLERLPRAVGMWIIPIVALVVICDVSTGFLVGGGIYIIVALLGYTLARRKIPIAWIALLALLFQFLHLGKGEMRNEFWGAESTRQSTGVTRVLEVYQHWIGASWDRLLSPEDEEQEKASIFDRANLIQMVALVVHDTPATRPFITGQTYGQIPILLVPRFLWANKPRGSLPSETLGIYYELQDEESVNFTAIGFGVIAEAWANFGWLGVGLVGALFGVLSLFGIGISRGLSTSSVGFLVGVVFLAYTFQLEQTLGPYLISISQSLIFCVGALLFMSRQKDRGGRHPVHNGTKPVLAVALSGKNANPASDPNGLPSSPEMSLRARRVQVNRLRTQVKHSPSETPENPEF